MNTNEKSHTEIFWLTLINKVFGIINPGEYIEFQKRVRIEHVKFIDAYIPSTGTLIEQKSPGKDLDAAFVQAKNYHDWLPLSQRGRYIITCDFNEIHVHDMEEPTKKPEVILVENATKDNLSFMLTPGDTLPIALKLSVEAGELVKKLYESLLSSLNEIAKEKNYNEHKYRKARDEINVFCVRLVFLLYAEDSGLFEKKQFQSYLEARKKTARASLRELFTVLNQQPHEREAFIDDELKAFKFVNGGLFADSVDFPQLSDDELHIILNDMAERFDWSKISPTIFGAIFEATLNDETRKLGGIHYTSVENIHRVIDPLFLNDLEETLNKILNEPQSWERSQKLLAFQDKLAALRFLDPACGSGNFLTESFISLRRIENILLAHIPENERPDVKVSINQFHGIERHNFAVNIAKTALWISDHQMWRETQSTIRTKKPPLPLENYDGIEEADALRADLLVKGWRIPHDDMLYIMGNPPFLGYSHKDKGQKEIISKMFTNWKVDYVAGWFYEASKILQDKNTKAAFVATNSVCQGEQASGIFKPLSENWHIKIDFAYKPFVWKNELPDPKKMAHVHVVIIGFSTNPPELRKLYTTPDTKKPEEVKNINFYLVEGPDEDVAEPSDKPISPDAPEMKGGNRPAGKNLIINGEDYADFIRKEPRAAKYIKRFMMGNEFINNIPRYCLWLVDATPQEIKSMPLVYERVEACKAERLKGAPDRKKLANTAWLFREQMNPIQYIAIPVVSSEKRRYIPMGWLDDSVIPGNKLHIIPNSTLYHFGVLTSSVHMAWTRRVCGRLKSDYSYSNSIVYNTFAWPTPTPEQREQIEKTAQEILDARALYPDSSFAAMYDDSLMPVELRRAHERNDHAVCRAYGWNDGISEEDIVSELFRLYRKLLA